MDVEPPVTIGKKRRAFSIIVVFSFLFVGTLIALAILVGPYLYAPLESLFFGTARRAADANEQHYRDHVWVMYSIPSALISAWLCRVMFRRKPHRRRRPLRRKLAQQRAKRRRMGASDGLSGINDHQAEDEGGEDAWGEDNAQRRGRGYRHILPGHRHRHRHVHPNDRR